MTGKVCDLALAVWGFKPEAKRVEAAGISYECRLVLDKIALKKCTLPVCRSVLQSEQPEEDTNSDRSHLFDTDDEKYMKFLLKLDPNDTKNQDHYKVLGLSKLRWQATFSEIRTCYRAKVLKHHPDKKKAKGIALPKGEEYFTCITKAYEQLGMDKDKRRAFDSIDHKFNDAIPTEKSITKENFFNELAPVFDLNARWSSRQPVPGLGVTDSERRHVEDFYNFWFDFSSWREFSYLDEEDKERGEDRYERREMEKVNKAERERRRKEEVKRIRRLVEMAYAKDPRIVKFKKEDQEAKERVKEEKKRIQREKQEAIEREKREAEEVVQRAKQEEEDRIRADREVEKKAKEVAKKAANEQKKRLKKMAEEAGHWTEIALEKLEEMERVERLCFSLKTDEMKDLCDRLETLKVGEEILSILRETDAGKSAVKQAIKVEDKGKENEKSQWTNEEIQLLIKAASRVYPPGTVERWIVIAEYINEHRKDKSTPPKTEKQVVKQCKAVQTMSVKLPEATQNSLGTALPDEDNWSSQEQKQLEDALKKHPASDPDRWDKISTDIGTKSKKACIRRFKHLVQMVKNKK